VHQSSVDLVALNPQPLPPGGSLDFVAVAASPAESPGPVAAGEATRT
jgi:hypothetical protein